MDEFTERMIAAGEAAKESQLRGYPSITVKCWECVTVFEKTVNIPLQDWLAWEAEGKPVLSGSCPKHDYSDGDE
tara:strand:- start:104 stop:325 length:222 start_codon:yes stop_codon:yes gene_type:complete